MTKRKKKNEKNRKKIMVIGILCIALLGIGIFLYLNHNTNIYVGKWEHYVNWRKGGKIVRQSYSYVDIKKDGTFSFYGRDSNDPPYIENYSGTYNINSDNLYLYFTYDNQELAALSFMKDNKLCYIDEECESYYLKKSSKEEMTLELPETIPHIEYNEYQSILSKKENAIVIFVNDTCSHCKDYKKTLKKINKDYSTPLYYYNDELDALDNIGINKIPTTFIIKNGSIVKKLFGAIEYNEIINVLKNNNIV